MGALIGLAVGDALGAAVGFEPRGCFEPVTGFRGGGPQKTAGRCFKSKVAQLAKARLTSGRRRGVLNMAQDFTGSKFPEHTSEISTRWIDTHL
jgi:hypothetical protein